MPSRVGGLIKPGSLILLVPDMLLGWSIAHQEFTINDYYYFSKLLSLINRLGIKLTILNEIRALSNLDVIVFNYPEKPFTREEIKILHNFMSKGGRVIILGYYNNEDGVADNVNSFTRHYGVIINNDVVIDKANSMDKEGLFIITSRIHASLRGVRRVLLPCTASIRSVNEKSINLIMSEDTAVSSKYGHVPISLFKLIKVGMGELIVGGTCVFWDNYSIDKLDNEKFVINLLNKD